MNPIILLIDDDDDVLMYVKYEISKANTPCEVISANSVDEGLALLEKHPPSLVIVDRNMLGGSAWDFIQSYRSNPKNRGEVIIFTASVNIEDVEKARKNGIQILEKPLTREKFMDLYKNINVSIKETR